MPIKMETPTSEAEQEQKAESTSEQVIKPGGWTKLSDTLDAFNPKACEALQKQDKQFESDLQAATERRDKEKRLQDQDPQELFLKTNYDQYSHQVGQFIFDHKPFENAHQSYIKNQSEWLLERQRQTENHFFNPARTKRKATVAFAQELQTRRLNKIELEALTIENTPARAMITAERATMAASKIILHDQFTDQQYVERTGWSRVKTEGKYDAGYAPQEKIQCGSSLIVYEQRTNPHYNHLGDYHMFDLGAYTHIMNALNLITGSNDNKPNQENEQKLAKLMLNFARNGQAVKLEGLKLINPKSTKDNVDALNRIFYHTFIKEAARRMLPQDTSHDLPLATIQARALQLIILGHLSLEEVFSQYADYGVFTGKNIGQNIPELKSKMMLINNLYDKTILSQTQENASPYIQYWKKNPEAILCASRPRLRQELQDVYGGASDTDGEGYESDQNAQDSRSKNYRKRLKSTHA